MDFYLPEGAVVRQEAPGLVKWQPRKPYKTKRKSERKQVAAATHNQMASKTYWDAIRLGKAHDEALKTAIEETDKELDARNEAIRVKQEEMDAALEAKHAAAQASDDDDGELLALLRDQSEADNTDCVVLSVITRTSDSEAGDSEEGDGAEEDGHLSSSDDATSSSDSE
jgi:hypothetical protein